MKLLYKKLLFAICCLPTIALAQTVSGNQLNINSTTSATNGISTATTGGTPTVYSSFSQTPTSTYINTTNTVTGSRSGLFTQSTGTPGNGLGTNIYSTDNISLYSGTYNPISGNIENNNLINMTPTQFDLLTNSGSTLRLGNASTSNGVTVTSNSVNIGTLSTVAPTVNIGASNATTNITGTTNINSSGNADTTIGNSGVGVVTIQSGTNSIVVNNTGTTVSGSMTVSGDTSMNGPNNNIGTTQASVNQIGTYSGSTNTIGGSGVTNTVLGSTNINTTGTASSSIGNSTGTVGVTGSTVTVTGATNINTAGTANTSIGNATGTVGVSGSTVNVATNSGSTVNIGSTTGNSTVNMNGNRIQNVGNAVAGTDAVNLNQLNNAISSTNNAINGLQNQMNSAKAGIAGVTAATNLPGLVQGQKYNFGLGWGNYLAYNGIAVGGNARVTDNVTLKVSGSATSGVYSGGAGLAIGF